MPVNTGLATVGVAIQDDPKVPRDKPDFVHGLTAGNPFAMERTVDTLAVACGTRSNSDAFVSEINMNPSITTLSYQEVAPIYFYGALGHLETEQVGPGLYKHTVTVGETLPDLTVFGAMGQADALGFGRTWGCKVDQLEVAFSDTEPLTLSPNFMGIDLERLDENPNGGIPPLCYSGYYSPVGGEFKIDTASQVPQEATVTEASVTITNDSEPVRDPTTKKPAAIGPKKNKVAVSYSVVPETYELWWRMVTGSSVGRTPSGHVVYGSYSMKYVHVDNPDFTLTIRGSKVPFACDPPEADPEGGSAVFEFTSEESFMEKVGSSPVVVEIVNDVPDYFDPESYALPASVPEPVSYGEVLPGVDAEQLGDFHVSGRSKVITGTATRVSGREGVEDGYYLPLALDEWEGATATPNALAREVGVPVPFEDGYAVVPIGFDGIEVGSVTVKDAGGEETTYELAVDTTEDLPAVTVSVATGSGLGKDYADFGEVKVSNRSRTVTGTLTRVAGFTQFDENHPELQQGYYVALDLDPWDGTELRLRKGDWHDWKPCKDDGVFICDVGFDGVEADAVQLKDKEGTTVEFALDLVPAEELPTVTASVAKGSFLGVEYAETGSYLVSNRSRTVTGTANQKTATGWDSSGDKTGYFFPLHLEGASCIKTAKHPEGRPVDETGNVLLLLGEESPTLEYVDVVGCDETTTRYTFSVNAAAKVRAQRRRPVAKPKDKDE